MKTAVIQMLVGADKRTNLRNALSKISKAHGEGAKLECFNSPYGTGFFSKYAEEIPGGESTIELAAVAKRLGIWLVGGTIPERGEHGDLYNTCPVFSPAGELVTRYRKASSPSAPTMHLFDIDIPGKITFKESATLSAGSSLATFPLSQDWRVGLGICYDLRFPEFSSILSSQLACNLLIFPSAFNTVTGPLHWHLLQRARAVDQQSYLITCSPARNPDPTGYQAYGHSLVVAPTGQVVAEAGEGEEIIYAELDPQEIERVRREIPSLQQKRPDIYSLPTIK